MPGKPNELMASGWNGETHQQRKMRSSFIYESMHLLCEPAIMYTAVDGPVSQLVARRSSATEIGR